MNWSFHWKIWILKPYINTFEALRFLPQSKCSTFPFVYLLFFEFDNFFKKNISTIQKRKSDSFHILKFIFDFVYDGGIVQD